MDSTVYPNNALKDVQNPAFASFLDCARWMAAAIVFLGHLRDPLFLGFGDVPAADRNMAISAWYFITGLHTEAVVVFFVLSGFLVGGLGSAKVCDGRFRSSDYFIDRATRLYVAYLPALLLVALLDGAGSHWFADTGFYTHLHPMFVQKIAGGPFLDNYNPATFLMNLAMLQTIFSAPFGSDDPLWTISYEFWFYIVFGFALIAATARNLVTRGLWCLLALGLAALLGSVFIAYMGLWLAGVGAAFIPWRRVERPVSALILFLVALAVARGGMQYLRAVPWAHLAKNYVVALTFAWLLVSMRASAFRPLAACAGFNRLVAGFSYSLYLIHFPLMLFILGALHQTGRFAGIATGYSPANPLGLFVFGLTIAIVYLSAWLFARATEMQTADVRRRVKSWIAPVIQPAPGRA